MAIQLRAFRDDTVQIWPAVLVVKRSAGVALVINLRCKVMDHESEGSAVALIPRVLVNQGPKRGNIGPTKGTNVLFNISFLKNLWDWHSDVHSKSPQMVIDIYRIGTFSFLTAQWACPSFALKSPFRRYIGARVHLINLNWFVTNSAHCNRTL